MILSVFALLAALGLGAGGILRLRSLARYNRRRRRRGKAPLRTDGLTWLILILAAVLLGAAVLLWPDSTAAQPEATQPTDLETQSAFGWREENGARFYLLPDGSRAAGWQDLPDGRFYFRDDGTMYTGWLEQNGTEYYLNPDGTMARGETVIGGQTFFFTASGAGVLLVNPWHPVPADYAPDLVALDEYYGSAGMQVDRSCLEALTQMIDDCNAAGSRAYVLSAYRSYEKQAQLYERKVERLMAGGLSRADAEQKAAAVVVLPGTSEHHLGLAVDIIDTSLWDLVAEQEDLPAQQWLMENCWRYGFILRYPKDRTAVTGVIYEPWHYRYVGKELAAELRESGLTMEEYMADLS